jgi:acyl-coenzyme A thioesterase PaaI-like protein
VGDVLTALGRPLHVGRRTQVWEVRILKEGRNAAFFTCTQLILDPS